MKNIDTIKPFQSTISQTNLGILTTLEAEIELSAKDSITFDHKTLLTNYIQKRPNI